jgi:hypothetical protein
MKTKRKRRARSKFSKDVANILSGYVSELPPKEQEVKVRAFENAVVGICRRGASPKEGATPNG